MKTNKQYLLTLAFGVFLVFMGVMHFVVPKPFLAFIPNNWPQETLNYAAGLIEIVLGLGVFLKSTRKISALGILLLMIAFLPVHYFDMFKETPAIGSFTVAVIRFPLQFVLIYWAWIIYRTKSTKKN